MAIHGLGRGADVPGKQFTVVGVYVDGGGGRWDHDRADGVATVGVASPVNPTCGPGRDSTRLRRLPMPEEREVTYQPRGRIQNASGFC
jgi:hypothetical protein